MHNPITQNRTYLVIYLTLWVTLGVIQVALFYYLLKVPLTPSIIDATLFNLFLSLLGLAVWPLVVFSSLERAYLSNTLFTHLVGAIVLIAAWLGISVVMLNTIFESNTTYISFLNSSLPWRVAQGAIIYLLFALNYYLYVYNEDYRERKVNEAELKRSLKEAELSMLKSQLNPHFIFNSLNSISSLTMTNPEKAQEMVIALSDFLRYAVKPGQSELISLNEELNAIDQFILIEKVRFGERLRVSITCDDVSKNMKVPPLIIQPLVENAVKYGVHETTEQGNISITCSSKGALLEVVVKNTFDQESNNATKTGVGLVNVRNRLKLLYESDGLLQISKKEKLFVVKLMIPQI